MGDATRRISTRGLAMLLVGSAAFLPGAQAAEPPIVACTFAPDGTTVLSGSQRGIEVRAWPDLTVQKRLECPLSHVHELAFSPSGNVLAAVGGSPAESGGILFYRWPAGTLLGHHRVADDLVYQADWRPDGQQVALACHDGRVLLVDPAGRLEGEFKGHSSAVTGVAYLADAAHLVSVGLDQTLRVWELSSGRSIRRMNQHTRAVRAIVVRPHDDSGRHMVATAADDGTIRLWWPLVGRLVRFARLPSPPRGVAWTADGGRLLAACRDGQLRVIDPRTVNILADRTVASGWAHAVASSADSTTAVVGAANGQLVPVAIGQE